MIVCRTVDNECMGVDFFINNCGVSLVYQNRNSIRL